MVPHYRNDRFDLSLLESPLLITESKESFVSLQRELARETKPKNIVERIFLADVAASVWQTMRLPRCKDNIVNLAFRQGILEVLDRERWSATGSQSRRRGKR